MLVEFYIYIYIYNFNFKMIHQNILKLKHFIPIKKNKITTKRKLITLVYFKRTVCLCPCGASRNRTKHSQFS